MFAIVLLASLRVHAQERKGAIKGKITDELGLALPGATVIIPTLSTKGAVTDGNGQFTLMDMASGSYELEVRFMGYTDMTKEVTVTAGSTTTLAIGMEPGVTLGEEVLILGDRLKGQAKALNQQKTNANITNIVAADQMGRFPDANIGDAMKRVAGITMQYDQGEARDIIIRGMAPQLNSVMINGERIPSAEGNNRRVQMDLIPSDMVQTIEVNKAVTPDMDADAIGGAVNLVTRAAPSGLRLSGTLGSGYNFLSNKPTATGALVLGNRYLADKLGVVLSASYHNHNFGSDNVEAVWVDKGGQVLLDEFDIRKYLVRRVRRSASLNLDYRLHAHHTLYLSGMYNWRDDWENRFRFRAGKMEDAYDDFVEDPVGNAASWNPLGGGRFATLARVGRQTKGGANTDRINNQRLEDQRVRNITLKGEHLLGRQLKLNWSGTYAKASEERPQERYISYRTGDISVIQDISDPRKPLITTVEEDAWQNLELNEITEENQLTFEEDLNFRLDMQLPLQDNGIIKFGARLRDKFKKRSNDFIEYSPLDEATFERLGNLSISDESDADYLNGGQYQVGQFVDRTFLGDLDLQNPALFEAEDKLDEYLPGNYTAEETISALYVMSDYQLTRHLSAIVGLRMEHTGVDYTGFSLDVESEEIGQRTGSDSYTNILPGIHLKYDLSENTILRAAWTNTLSRPDYFALVPFVEFDPDEQQIAFGNPRLSPATSMNFDLMAENYFKSVGLVSAGGFYKDIDNFIYNYTRQNSAVPGFGDDLQATSPENGGTAKVYGFEVSAQRQLDFLPGFLKGFGIYTNYTFTQSETDGIQGRDGEGLSLPGTAQHMVNVSLSYETEKLVLRVSLNHTDDYLDELGSDTFNDRYYDKQTFLDVNGSYAFTPKLRAFFEVNNLTNQPLRYYQGIRDRLMQEEFYNVRASFGVKFDLFGERRQ